MYVLFSSRLCAFAVKKDFLKIMSLNARIILAASLVLAIFLALTGIALDHAFRDSARAAREERLQGQLYLLIAAAEVDEGGLLAMPAQLQEPRFGQPGSGLYATIDDGRGKTRWRSQSALNVSLPADVLLAAGERRFAELPSANGVSLPLSQTSMRGIGLASRGKLPWPGFCSHFSPRSMIGTCARPKPTGVATAYGEPLRHR